MSYLVDANILSEPTKTKPNARVIDWLERHERELVIDPVILGEIRFGILLLAAGKRRLRLEEWFEAGIGRIRCLSWDEATAMRWAELLANLRLAGRAMPLKDSLIAATALLHGLTIATHDRRDFEFAGVPVVDPFDS